MTPKTLARWLKADALAFLKLTNEQRAEKEAFWRQVLRLPKP